RYRLHPDHRHAGWLAVDGCVAARDPHFHRDHDLPHHRPDHLLLFEADEPDHVEDVTGFADAKLAALLAHESQLRSTMYIEPDDDGTQRRRFEQVIRDRLARVGAVVGVAEGEAYRRLGL
ncbi:MAG: PIG-L family deacetylase, partial [Acidimicrobiales bacterium]|nr:PIG-L family deacetylase [Acidimicrobiales bacterium]